MIPDFNNFSVMNVIGITFGIFAAKRDYKKESTGDLL